MTGKIIANTQGVPFIYVLSISDRHTDPQYSLNEIFEAAQNYAPCVLHFEDLDTQVTSETRSLFLNKLDGFSAKGGVLIIGTSNHPENIDEALTSRPSRFDRTYIYGVPTKLYREQYLISRFKRLLETDNLEDQVLKTLSYAAEKTEKYSYVFLQELIVNTGFIMAHKPEVNIVDAINQSLNDTRKQLEKSNSEKLAEQMLQNNETKDKMSFR